MIRNIDPLLRPDLLKVLARGAGEGRPVIHLRGADARQVSRAVLSLLPFDAVVPRHAIVLTGKLQLFGNFLFKKGVIGEFLVE
jgi:L-fucose mutarotase/ribose pyranase (RbsD/FucU family)